MLVEYWYTMKLCALLELAQARDKSLLHVGLQVSPEKKITHIV